MPKTVNCVKLGHEAKGLARAPYPGELGERILNNVSQQAWSEWLAHQTMLINENHLSPRKAETRKYLETQMVKYLFEGGADQVDGYVDPDAKPAN